MSKFSNYKILHLLQKQNVNKSPQNVPSIPFLSRAIPLTNTNVNGKRQARTPHVSFSPVAIVAL